MRLIDADELIEIAHEMIQEDPGAFNGGYSYDAVTVEEINETPTVEAVPVVRCINCQHWGTGVTGETEHVKCCEYAKYMVGEDGYCCYGADMRKKV